MLFPEVVKEEGSKIIFANQVEKFLKYEAQVFTMFSNLTVESKAEMVDLPIMCEFPYVFPDDIIDLPLERERERD